ncbi:MAG: histidine kinase dimerization/phospho-acceptor domain-containing protein, partial [Anaerolineales bacterium]
MDHLRIAINDKEPNQMDALLDEWLSFNNYGQKKSFALEVNSLFIYIYNCSQLELSIEQSNQLIAELFPILAHTSQYIYQNDFTQILNQMNQEQASLEKLDQSKSDFISIAAHELKTPLTLLEGYTSMLREIIEQKKIFDEHIFLLLDGMDSGSRRLREIISDMIDVSLIDNELLSLSFQPTWLFKLLVKIEQEYQ